MKIAPGLRSQSSFIQRLWMCIAIRRVFLVSILMHVLFALLAIYLVVQTISPKRKLTFKSDPPSPNPTQRVLEHKVNLAKKQKTMSAPVSAKRITTSAISKISLPEMPAMPSMVNSPLSRMAGMNPGGQGMTMGSVSGALGSGGNGGGVPFFGMRTGEGFQGTFYDLKQTRSRRPTEMTPEKYTDVMRRFVGGSWNESSLSKYFKAPNPLYTQQLFIPLIKADVGPKAFGLEKVVQPRMWIVIYHATVIPPYSGRIRFAGKGDDLIVVRFSGRTVLDWGQPDMGRPSTWRPHAQAYKYPFTNGYGVMPGDWIDVRAGQSYEMDVLIGERPGGSFFAYLYIERAGASYQKDDHGTPILPLFRLGRGDLQLPSGAKAPPYAQNSEPWKSLQGVKTGALLNGLLP